MWGRTYFQLTPSSKPGMVLKPCRTLPTNKAWTLPTNKASHFHARFSRAQDHSWTFCLHLGCLRPSVKWSLGRWAFGSQIPPGHLPRTSHPRAAPCFSRGECSSSGTALLALRRGICQKKGLSRQPNPRASATERWECLAKISVK